MVSVAPSLTRLRGLPVLCALLLTGAAMAQTAEDRAWVGISLARGTDLGSRGEKLDERQQLDLRLPLPPLFLGKTILVPSLGYETRFVGLENRGVVAGRDEDERTRRFHRVQLGLSLIRPLPPRWLLIVGATGNTRTDFQAPFQLGMNTSWAGYAMASYTVDPNLRLTFGLVALWPFDVLPVIPMVGVSYRNGPYLLELVLPRLNLLRKFGDGLEAGLTGTFEQNVFHARFPADGQALGAYYVRESSLRFAPTVNVRLGSGSLWLSAQAGVDVLNDFALLGRDRERLDLAFTTTRPAPYARVALNWRPPRPSRPASAPVPPSARPPAPGR